MAWPPPAQQDWKEEGCIHQDMRGFIRRANHEKDQEITEDKADGNNDPHEVCSMVPLCRQG